MPVSDAIKSAILRCTGSQPASVWGNSAQVAVEMADLANEVAADIAKSHDWRDLTRIHTINGDGATEAFPKPGDYDRMVVASDVDDPASWFWGYCRIDSVNEWMRLRNGGFIAVSPGAWIILGGEFHFWPAPSGEAAFPYITRNFAADSDGAPKDSFTADSDEFRLDNRLLTLALVWRWRAMKGLEYAEDMQTYEIALSQAQSRDKGARVLRSRPRRWNIQTAYPWSLGS